MTFPAPTIIANASGFSRAPLALLRLSGPGTFALCSRLCDALPPSPRPLPGATLCHANFLLTDTLRVPCTLIRFDGPRSFTGEDSIEILIPGNPHLIERVIARFTSERDVREAGPGEFSARAFFSGKLSLEQAEGLAATIAAHTDAQLRAADDLLEGTTGRRYRAWADEAATLLALVEAGIDFTDQEDVVPIERSALLSRLDTLTSTLRSHVSWNEGTEAAATLKTAVLVGEPNAGKSTLYNALLGRRRSIVSSIAGTTRDAIAEELDLGQFISSSLTGDKRITLIDLAGLEPTTAGTIDAQAQAVAIQTIRRADIIIWCDPLGRFRSDLFASASHPPHQTILRVHTKADLALTRHHADAPNVLSLCALDGWNLLALKRALADAASSHNADPSGPTNSAWLLPRHRRTLMDALNNLDRCRAILAHNPEHARALDRPELIAGELRHALDHLGELVGDISPDDIIGRIFATFCVGK